MIIAGSHVETHPTLEHIYAEIAGDVYHGRHVFGALETAPSAQEPREKSESE